jgi:hypothetical protein
MEFGLTTTRRAQRQRGEPVGARVATGTIRLQPPRFGVRVSLSCLTGVRVDDHRRPDVLWITYTAIAWATRDGGRSS